MEVKHSAHHRLPCEEGHGQTGPGRGGDATGSQCGITVMHINNGYMYTKSTAEYKTG